MSEKQRVRVVIEYDAEVYEDESDDIFDICATELETIMTYGLNYALPDLESDEVLIWVEPIFGTIE